MVVHHVLEYVCRAGVPIKLISKFLYILPLIEGEFDISTCLSRMFTQRRVTLIAQRILDDGTRVI